MGVTWQGATPEDVLAVSASLIPDDLASLQAIAGCDSIDEAKELMCRMRCTATLMMSCRVDGVPVAVIGISRYRRGVCLGWAYTTAGVEAIGLAYTRGTRRAIDSVMRSGQYHRMEVWCWTGHRTSQRWVKAMGFQCEGIMRRTGTEGEDVALWSRIIE